MLLLRRLTLNLNEVTFALRENERMKRTINIDDEHNAIVVVEYEQGRNHSRRHDGPRGRSKSQSHLLCLFYVGFVCFPLFVMFLVQIF